MSYPPFDPPTTSLLSKCKPSAFLTPILAPLLPAFLVRSMPTTRATAAPVASLSAMKIATCSFKAKLAAAGPVGPVMAA